LFLSLEPILRDSTQLFFIDSQMFVQSLQEPCPRRTFRQDTRESHFLQISGNPLHLRLEVTGHASCGVFGEVMVLLRISEVDFWRWLLWTAPSAGNL